MSYSKSSLVFQPSIQSLYNHIEQLLQTLGHSYQKPQPLAGAILKGSEHFITKKGASPWQNKDFCAAYLAHFLPMNVARLLKGLERLSSTKALAQLEHQGIYDYGCGPFSFLVAYWIYFKNLPSSYKYFDIDPDVYALGRQLLSQLTTSSQQDFTSWLGKPTELKDSDPNNILCLSYSLNELSRIPAKFWDFQSLMIFEPSTQKDSRSLLEFRKNALEKDFKALAPCTHNFDCPLLSQSKKDWCFDRAYLDLPDETLDLYQKLPFDQKQVTYSYLFLEKKPTKTNQENKPTESLYGRIVGDELKEKGKSRMMICRNDQREFLSLLKKQKLDFKQDFGLQRGDIFKLSTDFKAQKKSNELRLQKKSEQGL